MRRAAKIDANQPGIVCELRQVPGVTVAVTSAAGDGFPDLVVGFRSRSYLIEIKDPAKSPSRRKLTPAQEQFHAEWRGQVDVAETTNDVLKIIGARTCGE